MQQYEADILLLEKVIDEEIKKRTQLHKAPDFPEYRTLLQAAFESNLLNSQQIKKHLLTFLFAGFCCLFGLSD